MVQFILLINSQLIFNCKAERAQSSRTQTSQSHALILLLSYYSSRSHGTAVCTTTCKGRNYCKLRDPASWQKMTSPDDSERTATVALPTASSAGFLAGELGTWLYSMPFRHHDRPKSHMVGHMDKLIGNCPMTGRYCVHWSTTHTHTHTHTVLSHLMIVTSKATTQECNYRILKSKKHIVSD